MRFILIGLLAVLFSGCYSSYSIPRSTVKVTNFAGSSGGSGSVVYHSPTLSNVLTNAHVCGVVANGGLVGTDASPGLAVVSYKVSNVHDLCLISVAGDLGASVALSSAPPEPMEHSTVAGHPKLLPTIINEGHFSAKDIIRIMVGVRECTAEERNTDGIGFICALLGKLPIIKTFESVVVSNTIQPGSSGSAVYGADGGISAVIFAGSGDLGYGQAVPYEYVSYFLKAEVHALDSKFPDTTMDFGIGQQAKSEYTKKFTELCEQNKNTSLKRVCDQFTDAISNSDLIFKR